jgi:hypothetical protein
MLGLDYSSSSEEEEEEREQEESVHQLQVEVPDKMHASTSNDSVEDEKKSKLVLPSAADMFAGGCADGLARKGSVSVSATKPSPVLSGSKRPAPSPILNPRQGQQKNPSSIGKHNSLLPPQLRGRANTPTTDLEGLGLRVAPPSRPTK